MTNNFDLPNVRKMTHSINKSSFELEKSILIVNTNKSLFI